MTQLLKRDSTAPSKEDELLVFLNQSTEFCNHFEDSYWYCYIVLVLFAFTVPVGLLGNLVVLINHTCFRKTSSSSNIFLLNLTLCDSGWILTLPFSLYITLRRPHITNIQIFCQFKKSFFNINIYGSILFLTLISFDRFVGTVHPISSLRWWNAAHRKCHCVCGPDPGSFLLCQNSHHYQNNNRLPAAVHCHACFLHHDGSSFEASPKRSKQPSERKAPASPYCRHTRLCGLLSALPHYGHHHGIHEDF
ncbi:lysophosphatidic acid receptor 6-like isoform X2 [Maylandia zebra]|uniref:lysophosphatidic acid receptor 6-like isoform X2 n=1 Tax=Maylandia zebra TaxID=106582 RepID=UPI0006474584|nr:lysophosphatidic acid receptor 6-like isoform X2 [Maylandia zebra]